MFNEPCITYPVLLIINYPVLLNRLLTNTEGSFRLELSSDVMTYFYAYNMYIRTYRIYTYSIRTYIGYIVLISMYNVQLIYTFHKIIINIFFYLIY